LSIKVSVKFPFSFSKSPRATFKKINHQVEIKSLPETVNSLSISATRKWIKSIKNSLVIKHRAYNEFISHKVTYLLCFINEFRLYTWEK
jgi:hypothetical protein